MCPMIFDPLSGFPMLDRRTASDKLYITQLLPTRYSINVTNTFGGYQWVTSRKDLRTIVRKFCRQICPCRGAGTRKPKCGPRRKVFE